MVLDRDDLDSLQVEAELEQAPFDAFLVTVEAAVAGEDRVERAVRCVPVALGVVPARLLAKADRSKRDGHRIDLRRLDAGEVQAELRRLVGHAVLGVLVAHEAFFFRSGDELAVDV